jgi:phosphatidate cytidylyltransferase
MSNLQQRILSSIAFVLLILGPLFLSERIAYTCYAVLGGFTLAELNRLLKLTSSQVNWLVSFSLYTVLIVIVYQIGFGDVTGLSNRLMMAIGILTVGLLWEVFRKNERPFESISTSIVGPLFVGLSFLGIVYFLGYRTDLPSPYLVISMFGLIWINDSAAYLLGRKIGRRKLFERLSPNKTIEGSMSGLIAAVLAGIGFSFIPGMPDRLTMIGFALICVIAGSLGDLFESRLKRMAGVKDSGRFLPGHGGFLDRFDAMMLAIPSSILYFEAVLPKI